MATDYKYLKEYIDQGDATEGQLLIPRKIYDVLIDEVDKKLLPRSEAGWYFGAAQIPGSSIDVDLDDVNTGKVRPIAEGAEFWLDKPTWSTTNIKPEKYGVAVRITEEMLEDAKWNMLDRSVRTLGKRFAENETKLILTALYGASDSVTGGAAITIANISRAIQYLEDNDYEATTMYLGNEVASDIRQIDTFMDADKHGSDEVNRNGFLGTIYGLRLYRFSTNAAPSTTYSKYAFVFDRAHAYAIAEKRPVTLKKFSLETFDMEGAVLSQRIAVKLIRDYAVCTITTS
ncbi:MAG: phage major capsid protein [Candidatus Paceibacterota bacterium]